MNSMQIYSSNMVQRVDNEYINHNYNIMKKKIEMIEEKGCINR